MSTNIFPVLASSLAGLIMVGGGIWLIYKEKIYIDRESKTITEIETPIGKFRTNVPALVLFVLGFVPLIYPIYSSRQTQDEVYLNGDLAGQGELVVYASIRTDSLSLPGPFQVRLPALDYPDVQLLYVRGNEIVNSGRPEQISEVGGKIKIRPQVIKEKNPAPAPPPFPESTKPIPSEFQ